jgi:CheY-like chemotaxis protein
MILVVDDHDDTRYALTRLLKSSGYEAAAVCDGSQALLYLQTHRPSLVILDCHMPCLNGFDVLRAVRSDAALADLPILMFSADPASEDHALCLGAHGFILKGSLDWAQLSAAVEKYAGSLADGAERAPPHSSQLRPDPESGHSDRS